MKQIPQQDLDKVLDINIVDTINEDVTLRKSGVNYIGICPFHEDKKPSLCVSPAKRIFKCFVCGEGGNVIAWRQKYDNISFVEAVHSLAQRHNIEIAKEEQTPEDIARYKDIEADNNLLNEAQKIFISGINHKEAQEYIKLRKISPDTAEIFGIGYCSATMLSDLQCKGYDMNRALSCNVAGQSERGLYPFFINRITFPYYNKRGQIVGWSARDIKGKSAVKYKNTGETRLFNKGSNLYGAYQARKTAIKEDRIYVVEGQMDVISMYQNGVLNVVAGSGTAFTETQRKILKSMTTNVVLVYDGDGAGISAAEKNILPLVKEGFKIRCVSLPTGQDPDDMAISLGSQFPDWIKKAEGSYVKFFGEHAFHPKMDTYEKLAVTKKICSIVAHEEDVVKRELLSELTEYSGYYLQELQQMTDEVVLPEKKERFEDGFVGIKEAAEFLDKDDPEIHLTNNFEKFIEKLGKKEPWAFYSGVAAVNQLQELQQVCEHIIFDNYEFDCNARKENSDCKLMKEMFKFGFKLEVYSDEGYKPFINYYITYYTELIGNERFPLEEQNAMVLRCGEMISYCKESMRAMYMTTWAKMLGLKRNELVQIIKPYVDERKAKAKNRNDEFIDDDFELNSERVPSYVEESDKYSHMLKQFGFYPYIRDGVPLCYMFRSDGGSFKRVGDFYMEPLLHVKSEVAEENKRIIKLNSLVKRTSQYVELPSKSLTKLSTITETLFMFGGYNFIQGSSADYEKIKACLSYDFRECVELKTYGQQQEGFFCFANAIYHEVDGEWKIEMTDDLGLMQHEDECYYSPAYSKMYAKIRDDNDKFKEVKKLVYKEVPAKDQLTFKRWSSLMNEVYKVNNNGKWAILFALLSAFRSEIHPIHRYFTSLFFTGPTGSGKTQIAVSVRSLFINSDVECYNFNNTSDAAFFSVLELLRDVPLVFEEYNDDKISDNIFQGLKSIVYDGDGKTKRRSASTNEVETSKVNSPVILLGQFAPSKDDGSLCNRIVLLDVPKKTDYTKQETDVFNELKRHERKGLSNILLEILQIRPIVKKYFAGLLDETIDEIKQEMKVRGKAVDIRLINTNSIFISMVKLLEKYCKHLELPFTLEEFKAISISKMIEQAELLRQTDKVAMFFNRISTLIDKGIVKSGRDFKVVTLDKDYVALKEGNKELPKGTRLLYINLSNVYDYYSNAGSLNGEKPMKLTDLRGNMYSHQAYVGNVTATRWSWMDSEDQPINSEVLKNIDEDMTGKSMAVVRNMVRKSTSSSAMVLNYDILESMGISWIREYKGKEDAKEEVPF